MNAALTNPDDRDRAQQADPYAPAYVVEVLINPQLRARNPGRPLTLCEALQVGHGPEPGRKPEPDLEPEAEP